MKREGVERGIKISLIKRFFYRKTERKREREEVYN